MRRFLQINTVFILVGLLASQAVARTGVAFSGRTGFSGSVVIGTPRAFVSRPIMARRAFSAQRFRPFNGDRVRQHFLTGFPVGGIWPDFWWPDTPVVQAPTPTDGASQTQLQPQIIVVHTDTPAHAASEPPPDFSYVAGCRAIPNGYHCDTAAH
jgi:hypothetical protein